jgi:protein TonB
VSPRLIAALAASFALHAALMAGLDGPYSLHPGLFSWLTQPAETRLQVALAAPRPEAVPTAKEAPASTTAGGALGVARYYRTRELDVVPGIMTRVMPEYPEHAARRFLAGRVVVRLFLDESGSVERVVALDAEPPGYFEQAAVDAFRAARFSPGMKDGRPVKVQITLEVNFEHPSPPKL